MRLIPWLAGLLLATLLAIRIDAPWIFIHDDNGAWTQAVATAHLRAGLARTRGQDFYLRRADGALVPYLHHPPLYPLLVAAAYRATGRSDPLATRLVPVAFHIAGLAGLALLGRRLFPDRPPVPTIALAIYATVPMSAFFGKMPFNEPVGLCWIVWACTFTAAYRARTAGSARRALAAAAAFWVLAGLTSWAAYAVLAGIVGLFAIETLAERRRRAERRPGAGGRPGAARAALALGGAGAATLALVLLHLAWAARGSLAGLLGAADAWGVYRLGARGVLKNLGVALDFHRNYFANVPFLLFGGWIAVTVRSLAAHRALPDASRLLLAGAAGCALWALVFLRQIAVHAYGQFWFLPFESLAAADLAARAWARLAGQPRLRASLAALAIAGTALSSTLFLAYRYGKPHGYAVRTSAWFASEFHTEP